MNKLNLSVLLEKARIAEKTTVYCVNTPHTTDFQIRPEIFITLCEALIEARETLDRIKNCLLDDEYYKYGSDGIIMQNICVSDLAFENITSKIEFGSSEGE